MPASYAIDTNLYIAASRDSAMRAGLARFTLRSGLRLHLNAVVLMELRAGARSDRQRESVDSLYAEFAGRGRLVVPSADAFAQAGRVLEDLAVREGFALASGPRSFTNDVLIAASCREHDVELVTANHRDFIAIARHLRRFRSVAPWP
jgi:predicted nucleic acid-binding protein